MAETVLIQAPKVSTDAEGVVNTGESPMERVEKFNRLRGRDRQFAEWLKGHNPEVAEAVAKCSAEIVLRHYESVGETRLKAVYPDFCRKRFLCSMCDAMRAGRTLGKYVDRVLSVLRKLRWQHVCYMVTFTVKDGESLIERVRHLRGAYRELMANRRRYLQDGSRRRRTYTESAKALGGLHSVEVKRGSNSGLWHPHLHAVWICEAEPDQYGLRDEWERLTGDSWVVDVRKFHSFESEDGVHVADREGIGKDLCEVVKYSLKFADLSFEDQYHASCVLRKALRSMRLIGSFGCLWGLKEENIEVDTLISDLDDDMAFVDLLFGWHAGQSAYRCLRQERGGVNILTGERVFATDV